MDRRHGVANVRALVAAALVAAAVASCRATAPTERPTETPAVAVVVVENAEQARRAVGKRVYVEGRAAEAKLSAAVVRSGLLVYCLDRPEWRADLSGTNVAVEGTLEWTEEFKARPSPDGAVSAGTDGGVFVVRLSEVRLVGAP